MSSVEGIVHIVPTPIHHHATWPELADYFLGAFDWYVGGKIGKIANNRVIDCK